MRVRVCMFAVVLSLKLLHTLAIAFNAIPTSKRFYCTVDPSRSDQELVWVFSYWVLQKYPDQGLKIFTFGAKVRGLKHTHAPTYFTSRRFSTALSTLPASQHYPTPYAHTHTHKETHMRTALR